MKKSLITLAIITSLSTMTGCGGGSSSSTETPTTPASTTTLAGTAAKGIILQGIVTAIELDANGKSLGEVGSATTDDSGHYSLVLTDDYQGGVVKLTISAGDNTTMKCDATSGCGEGNGFGSSIALGSGFSLDAMIKPEGENVSVQITPLTHMAAARALVAGANGKLNAASVANAISEVNQITGVNIMDTEVVDITSPTALASASATAKQLGLFNSGLADMLVSGEGAFQENLITNLNKLAGSFEDGEFTSDDGITITEITDAISMAASAIEKNSEIADLLSDSINIVETNIDVIKSQIVDGGFNPEPSDNAGSDQITQAKALITQARTFIEKIESDFTDPLDALSVDAETVADVLDADSAVMAELLVEALEQTITYIDEQNIDIFDEIDSESSFEHEVSITDQSGTSIGTMTVTFSADTSTGISIILNGSLEGEAATVNVTDLKLQANLTEGDLTTSVDGEETLIDAITASAAQLRLTGFIGNSTTSLTLNDITLTLSASEVVTLDTTEDGDNDGLESKISGASFNGDMVIASDGASFEGGVEIVLVGLANTQAEMPLSVQKIEVNGEFNSATKGSFSAGAKLTIDNAASFDTFGYLDHEASAYEHVYLETGLSIGDQAIIDAALENSEFVDQYVGPEVTSTDYFGFSKDQETGAYSNFYYMDENEGGDFGWVSRVDISGNFDSLPDLETTVLMEAKNGYGVMPETAEVEWLMFDNHKYENDMLINTTWVYAGVQLTFADPESADNFVQGTLTVMAEANVPELPEVIVVASVNRTELSGGDASITVSYDGKSFTLAVDSEDLDADEPEATLTLTNPDGVKLTANLSETVSGDAYLVGGAVFVGDTQVATIDETDNGLVLVRYSDGTFESLF